MLGYCRPRGLFVFPIYSASEHLAIVVGDGQGGTRGGWFASGRGSQGSRSRRLARRYSGWRPAAGRSRQMAILHQAARPPEPASNADDVDPLLLIMHMSSTFSGICRSRRDYHVPPHQRSQAPRNTRHPYSQHLLRAQPHRESVTTAKGYSASCQGANPSYITLSTISGFKPN